MDGQIHDKANTVKWENIDAEDKWAYCKILQTLQYNKMLEINYITKK